jgi:hypothetical protein
LHQRHPAALNAQLGQLSQPNGKVEQPRPVSHWKPVHVTVSAQAPGAVQLTPHAHDMLHITLRHEFTPLQLTLHGPGPHCTLRHALSPEHVS